MTQPAVPGGNVLATVTVTYNPDLAILRAQLDGLPREAWKVVVDNASAPDLREGLRALLRDRSDVRLLENARNEGLAAAINAGVRAAAAATPAPGLVLLLDQDTEPEAGSIEAMAEALHALAAADPAVAAVGPRLLDVDTGLEHGFHQVRGWRIARRHPGAGGAPLEVVGLNGSGTLARLAPFLDVGGMDGSLFIDHVDTEWSFRMRAAGYRLYGVPAARFHHRMGAAGKRYWLLKWRVWPYRSPLRHYYLFRNTVRLLRMRHVAAVWKAWAPLKLALTLVAHALFDPARGAQLAQMSRGLRDGLRGTQP